MTGTDRRYGIWSRNTCACAGGASGSRNASLSATDRSDGTVRPASDAIRCPSGPRANSMNRHASSLASDPAVMQ